MSHFEFVIPLQKDELRSSNKGDYKVEDVTTVDKLNHGIKQCITAFNSEGCAYILEHFDTLYSVLVQFRKVEWALIHKIFDQLICPSINQLLHFIQPLVEDVPDSETKLRTLNILKMNLYIFTQMHSSYHDRLNFESSTTVSEKIKGRKIKKTKFDETNWDWDETQRLMLIALYQLLQLQILKLWDPPIPEEQFINMCANCCYKVLETPSITLVKSKPLRNTLFQVLGLLIKRYSHGISCVVKIVQMLTLYEHVVSPLAQGVVMFVRDLGFKSLVNEIVKELVSSTEIANDNSSVRSFSNFLVEVAELEPEIMIPTIAELTQYLSQDPYSMRCCVLSVITEILLNKLSQAGLDDQDLEQREQFFDTLLEHALDNNAFVRSRVLQLWNKIVLQQAVPKTRFPIVVNMAKESLSDKSSIVCKHAISLLKSILEVNPYGRELDVQDKKNQLIAAEDTLQQLERTIGSLKNKSHENIWETLKPELVEYLSCAILVEGIEETSNEEMACLLLQGSLQENIKLITILLINRKYEVAYRLTKAVEHDYPAAESIRANIPSDNKFEYYLAIMREMFMDFKPPNEEANLSSSQEESNESEEDIESERLRIQKAYVVYLTDFLEFSKRMEEAIESITLILYEDSIAEVLEAINFLTSAYQCGVPHSEKGVQEMLNLTCRKEPAVKEALNAAFRQLYLDVSEKSSKSEKAEQEVERLSKLASSLDIGQLEALSKLIQDWVKNKEVDQAFITVLWDRVKMPLVDKKLKQIALVLLGMVTQENSILNEGDLPIIINNVLMNVDCGNPMDMFTVVLACRVIMNIFRCKSTSVTESTRLAPDHEVFAVLRNIVTKAFTKIPGNSDYCPPAQEVIDLIMQLCKSPAGLCEGLLCDLLDTMKAQSTPVLNGCDVEGTQQLATDDEGQSFMTTGSRPPGEELCEERIMPADMTVRFIYLVGFTAFKYGEFIENYHLETLKLKLRAEFRSISPTRDADKILEVTRQSVKLKAKGEDEIITENDLLAAADDIATEEVRKILDTQIVSGSGILAGFCKLVVAVCKRHQSFNNSHIKSVAVIALTQMMMVSSEFCNKHMQLMITLLEKSSEENVRINIVIAFGDLLFKFPNTVEPWTRFLYSRLRDDSANVRMCTLLMLSHLVTNEMVKVKGQISEVALCIIDSNYEIVDLAKLFFSELSLKGNTLYNVLPDIISHLSNPESNIVIEEKDFECILRFIMEQIQKEKQLENLVEKLCKRMKEALCERQWRDLAFCLSLLPWSDRSLRKLIDHSSYYSDRLMYQPVATLFLGIVSAVSKSTKPGLKEIGSELNAIINDVLTKGPRQQQQDPEESTVDKPTKTPGKTLRKVPAKTPGTVRKTVKKKRVKKYVSDSGSDNASEHSSSSDEDNFKEPVKTKTGTRTRKAPLRLF